MSAKLSDEQFNELLKLLRGLEQLHAQLLVQTQAKIAAMKTNGLSAMEQATAREMQLVACINEQEGLRRQLMSAIGREAGWKSNEARVLSVSQLAARCPEPQRRNLLDVAASLRERFLAVARATRVAGGIAAGILEHVQFVFSDVRNRERSCVGYSGRGAAVVGQSVSAFEAVG